MPTIPTVTMVVLKHTLTPTVKFQLITTRTLKTIKETEGLDLFSHPVRPVVELNTPQRNVALEQMQLTDRLLGIDDRKDKTRSKRKMLKATQMGLLKLQPQLWTSNATSTLRNCKWQTGDKWNTKTSSNTRGCLAATYGDHYRSNELK